MSIELTQKVKQLQEQVSWLQHELEAMSGRLLTLEAVQDFPAVDLAVDTLQPKRRGRPPKVQQ